MVLSGRAKIWLVTSCRRSWSVNSCLIFWCKGEAGEIIGERFWDSWGRLKSGDKNYGSVERPDPVWVFLRRGLVWDFFFVQELGLFKKNKNFLKAACFHLYHLSSQKASSLKGTWEYWTLPELSLRLSCAFLGLSQHRKELYLKKEFPAYKRGSLLITSWRLLTICSHFGSNAD